MSRSDILLEINIVSDLMLEGFCKLKEIRRIEDGPW